MNSDITIHPLTPADFEGVIKLGNRVHGDNYLDHASIKNIYQKGLKEELNASFVAYSQDTLVGFRLTYTPGSWHTDEWCSPELWSVDPADCCYFKCNTIDENFRHQGIGSRLLRESVKVSKQQGAAAGISHVWMQSPNNAAYLYFTHAGGKLVKKHPARWNDDCVNKGYVCPICGNDCHCDAGEMILYFND